MPCLPETHWAGGTPLKVRVTRALSGATGLGVGVLFTIGVPPPVLPPRSYLPDPPALPVFWPLVMVGVAMVVGRRL
ncbi:hypothetical protein D3C87_1793820 [compost metagenome]